VSSCVKTARQEMRIVECFLGILYIYVRGITKMAIESLINCQVINVVVKGT
jgi:hypothetical protein